ncbi:sensor histidine kinase [Comamonas antarctica]|uniref:Histidine kinase n=1 Tax=Comamonas antarctica TaxID=2743470 RepID=A0A6N1WZZ7_9BURK|nr:histidine kinase [Comamonas antarctica]QKV51653.1 histidine kinase [Comamonas antarctica]
MRGARLLRVLLGGIAGWLLWLGLALGAQAAPQQLTQARVQVEIDGRLQSADATLPYVWDQWHKGRQGHAVFELSMPLAEVPAEPVLLYFTRLGNAYEVRLNGNLLDSQGRLARFDGADHGMVPRLMTIPAGVLQRDNRLEIRIRADRARRAGVASPWVGTRAEILPLYESDYRQRVTGTQVAVIMGLLVGTVALALWWTQVDPTQPAGRRREPLYLFAAVAEYMWSLRVGNVLFAQPPLPRFWWDIVFTEAIGVWIAAMLMFSALAVDWHGRFSRAALERALKLLLVLGIFCAVGAQWGQLWLLTLWYAGLGVVSLCFVAEYSWAALRRGTRLHRLIAAALVFNVCVGVRDWAVFRLQMAHGGNSLMRYSSLLFGLLLIYIVLRRFREAGAKVRELLATMEQQVAAKEQALQASYAQVEQLAREQERVNERTRILRDLHDGVGAHISAAIRQLESGKARHDDVLLTLRDSLDQIKLSIDAMHLPAGDVTGLLANLRYRLEPKLSAAGIALHWDVDWIAPLARLDAAGMRHLQYMVFESLSNVLQHARASELRIAAKAGGTRVCIRIEDNGQGFDTARPRRNGLLSLQDRARAIGATLGIESIAGLTVVEITLG